MEEWWGSVGPAVVAEGDKGLPFSLSLSLPPILSLCFYVASYFTSLLLFLAGRTHLRRDSNFFSPVLLLSRRPSLR